MILGLGYAFFSSPNTNAIMSSVDKKYLGIASGMVATMRSLGQVLSMAIAMFCFSIFIGAVDITPSVYPAPIESTVVAFLVSPCSALLGVAASYARVPIHASFRRVPVTGRLSLRAGLSEGTRQADPGISGKS